MKIHEHQAKELFRSYNIPVPEGRMVFSANEIDDAIASFDSWPIVVKAQIHAGGRGKGGGVQLAKNANEAKAHAQNILGMNLVTHQTGPEGKEVKRLLIEDGCAIARELYLGLVLDRGTQKIAVMASTEGGMEIEEVAAKTPEKILTEFARVSEGLQPYQGRKLAFALGLEGKQVGKAVKFLTALFKLFVEKDCSLVEINPLVVTEGGDLLALDGKINFDDNALYRHPDVEQMRDENEDDQMELEAHSAGLSYIKLDGDIGCLVNGAGLAMASMDVIKHVGGNPANFLDVGGGANHEQVAKAFKIILSDSNVKAILVNIFGGIMRCDVIAEGIMIAVKEVGINVPLVVRLDGTKAEEGKKIIAESGMSIIAATSLSDAAEKAVAASKGGVA